MATALITALLFPAEFKGKYPELAVGLLYRRKPAQAVAKSSHLFTCQFNFKYIGALGTRP